MKDFLPLLIGLIWLGFTLYSKNQKSKKSGTEGSAVKRKPSILEQVLLGEQFNTFIQPETEPEPVVENSDEKVEEEALRMQPVESLKEQSPFLNYELSDFVEEGTHSVNENEENLFMGRKHLFEEEENSQLIDFDLRRAVIYSEILRTPYISY